MAGVVACNETWARRIRQVRVLTGGNLHPMAAYTLHRGLQTLAVRVRAELPPMIDGLQRRAGRSLSPLRDPTGR